MNGGALQFLRGEWKVQEKALFWQVHDIWRPWTETLIDERALSRCTHTLSPSFSLHRPVKQRYVVEPLYLLSRTHTLSLSLLAVSLQHSLTLTSRGMSTDLSRHTIRQKSLQKVYDFPSHSFAWLSTGLILDVCCLVTAFRQLPDRLSCTHFSSSRHIIFILCLIIASPHRGVVCS